MVVLLKCCRVVGACLFFAGSNPTTDQVIDAQDWLAGALMRFELSREAYWQAGFAYSGDNGPLLYTGALLGSIANGTQLEIGLSSGGVASQVEAVRTGPRVRLRGAFGYRSAGYPLPGAAPIAGEYASADATMRWTQRSFSSLGTVWYFTDTGTQSDLRLAKGYRASTNTLLQGVSTWRLIGGLPSQARPYLLQGNIFHSRWFSKYLTLEHRVDSDGTLGQGLFAGTRHQATHWLSLSSRTGLRREELSQREARRQEMVIGLTSRAAWSLAGINAEVTYSRTTDIPEARERVNTVVQVNFVPATTHLLTTQCSAEFDKRLRPQSWQVGISYQFVVDPNALAAMSHLFESAHVRIRVFDDVNANGIYDDGIDKPLVGVPLVVDGKSTLVTGADGAVTTNDLISGLHEIRLDDRFIPDRARMTTPQRQKIFINGGTSRAEFGITQAARVYLHFFNDLNGDGIESADEPGIPGIRVRLSNIQRTVEATVDENGFVVIEGVASGKFKIEADPASLPPEMILDQRSIVLDVQPLALVNQSVPVRANRGLLVTVYADSNRNGRRDLGEPPIEYAEAIFAGKQGRTSAEGRLLLRDLPAGKRQLVVRYKNQVRQIEVEIPAAPSLRSIEVGL